jgi:hypothetical protein
MGLLGCPASFQRLMEGILWDIPNVLVYIDNLLVHTDTHEKHLQEKCVFGNKEVLFFPGFIPSFPVELCFLVRAIEICSGSGKHPYYRWNKTREE